MVERVNVRDIRKFAMEHPEGSVVLVPKMECADDTIQRKNQKRITTIEAAKIIEWHSNIAITTSGCYQWKEIYFANRIGCFTEA